MRTRQSVTGPAEAGRLEEACRNDGGVARQSTVGPLGHQHANCTELTAKYALRTNEKAAVFPDFCLLLRLVGTSPPSNRHRCGVTAPHPSPLLRKQRGNIRRSSNRQAQLFIA